LSLRPLHSLDFLLITAGSETRFKFILPPFWPIGVVHSLLSLILDLSLLTLHSFTTKNHTYELHDLTPRTATPRLAAYDQHWYRLLMESQRSGSIMAASVRFLLKRAAEKTFNKTMVGMNHTTNPFTQNEANRTISPSATKQIIDMLVFQDSKSVRTSTIILAAFNVLAALATAVSILYDSYWSSKRCAPKFKAT
jgi:hypothetical protein